MCGGTVHKKTDDYSDTGLSPRVRGNLYMERNEIVMLGSIPACAGEPPQIVILTLTPGVYPRVCVETIGRIAGQAD